MPTSPPDLDSMRRPAPSGPARRRALAAAGLGMGLGLAGAAMLGMHEAPGQIQKLPDGSRIELRGWTFGPNHTFIDGRGWQRLLLQGGDGWAGRGGYRGTHEDMGNDLVLWFRSDEISFPGRTITPAWIDPHGCRISTGSGWSDTLPHWALASARRVFWERRDLQPPEQRWVYAPRITPRRGQDPLQYAIVEQGHPKPLANFTVPGARRVSTETAGTPARLPIRKVVGDTTFILNDLRHELVGRFPLSRSSVSFRYEGKGPHSRSWVPVRVLLEDGTGNELVSLPPPAGAGERVLFETLCRRDPAWKLSVRFARPNPLRVPPDAVGTVRNVRVPRAGEMAELSDTFSAGDMGVRLEHLLATAHPPARFGRTDGTWGVLQFNVSAPEGGQLYLLGLTDEHGRRLFPNRAGLPLMTSAMSNLSTQDSLGDTPIVWPVYYPFGTRRLNVTFGIHRTRTAEFIVRP